MSKVQIKKDSSKIEKAAKKLPSDMELALREGVIAKKAKMSVKAVRNLSDKERESLEKKVVAQVKAECAAKKPEKKLLPKVPHKKFISKEPSHGMPGVTRISTITGLMSSPSDRKWNLFLKEGPYWNYLVKFIASKNIFAGRQDRVEEAVMNTCEKVGRFMMDKRYKYPEVGKGVFRAWLKTVAMHTALDLLKEIRRQERILGEETTKVAKPEFDKMHDDLVRVGNRIKKKQEKNPLPGGVDEEIAPSSDRDLDRYDLSAGFDRNVAPAPKKENEKKVHLVTSLDSNPFIDDEAPVNYDPAAMFDYMNKLSKEDLRWVQKLQVHVLYIALGYVLTNEKISAEKRELLRLRFGLDMKVKDIYANPRFSSKSRTAFDVQMNRATEELRKEIKSWWTMVAPSKNDFADETVMKFWRELGGSDKRAKIASALQDKAIEIAGRIK